MSSSESEVNVHEEQLAVGADVEEFDPNVPIPEYSPEELEKLVAFVQQMTVLFALDQRDWTPETLDVVRRWFMDVRKLVLLIYYNGNNLSACLNFPGVGAHDLTYFLREPNQIFTVDDFHDEVIFGVLHEDIDGALLAVLDKVYSPIFFQYEDWKENVKANLMGALNRFLSLLTGLHHKISGVTVLYVPNTVKNLVPEVAVLDRELMKNLEAIAVHWGSQIRLCLTDKTQLVPYDLLCPPDEYDFWKYRYEILQGLHAQLSCEDVENIIKVLRRAQSVYIKAICELTEDCEREMHEAKSNIKYLQLLVEPCQELNDSENPAAIAPLLPRIVHLFRYIWLNSTYFNTSESITGLFRCLTNQIIIFCRKHIEIEKILDGNPRFGIKMCNMTIDACLSYKKIYEIMSKQHAERNPEVGWELDVPMIFNHLDAYIERLIDLIDIAEAMIVFGRMDETENIMKPRFGGPRGADLEATCEKVERMFNAGLERIKTKSMDILLDVHSNQWYEDVLKYRQLVKDLEEVIQRLFANAFTNISNVEEGIEVLITLYFFSYRQTIRHVYIQKVSYVWNMFIDEIDNTNKRILSRATVRYSWVPKDASRALNLKTSIERLKWIKSRFDYAEWLPEVPQSITAINEFNKLVTDYTKNMKKAYEDWASKYEYDLQTKLDRPLIARSKTYAGLIECNIDREILDICEHAKYFHLMGYEIPTPIQVIYAKYDILKSTCNNVLTVALDYNKIIMMLSVEERKLFRALIQSCDRKTSPGMSKLTWGGELSDEYIAECVKQTSDFQGFINIYKRATKEIGDICEKICDIPILRFRTSVPIKLETLVQNLKSYRSKTLKKLLEYYKVIVELIVVVYKGFEPQISHMTSEWLLYVQRFDKMIEASLLTSSKNSLLEIYNNLHGDGTMDPSPILSVEIDVIDKKIVFDPELQSIADLLSNVLIYIIKCIELFPRLWEKFQLPEYDDCKQFYLIVSDNPECVELQIKINGEIRKNEEELVEYLENWLPFRSVWELDKENFMSVYENTDLSAAQFDSNIERYTEIANQVTMLDTVTNVYYIVVNASKLKNTILGHIDDWQQRHMNLLKKTAYDRMKDTYEYIHKNGDAVMQVPRTIAAMKESIYLHERLMQEAPRKKGEFPGIYELFRVLDKYEISYSHEMHELVARLEGEWQSYLKKLAEAEEMLGTSKEDFKLMLLRGAEKFKATAKSLMDEFTNNVPTSSSTHPVTAMIFLKFAREELDSMMESQKALIDDLIAFKVSLGKNLNLKKMSEDLAMLDEVWETVVEWYYAWEEYKVGNFWHMNILDMDDKSDDLYKRLNRLYKTYYDKNWEILEITKKKVYEFRKTLPLLEALKNPAMRLRHWNRVRAAVKQNFDEQADSFNLESIMKMNFQNFEEDILDISTAATMELNIENGLKNIQDIWETLNIEMAHFKDGIYRIKTVDECFEVLEEHLTQISTMKSTRFIAPFAVEADYWEKTLAYIMETLEKALIVQRSWLYLDNIFSGEDIKRQLPGEYVKFRDLTDQWRIISSKMAGVSSAVKATHLRPPPFLLNRFDHMDKMFEGIQRALEVYLETKRQAFPRFYFISNDDLLEILGNSKKPNLVQPQLKKMFDNLCKVELKKDTVRKVVYWNTLGMYSAEDEYVEFNKPFRIMGPSEAWLNQVDNSMLACLKTKLVATRAAFKKMKAQQDVWLNQWPGQLCLTTSQIQWTTNCVRSLIFCKMVEDRWPLKKLKKKQNKVLSKLSEMSRMELETQLRLKVNSMITLEIHGRDVIEKLYKNSCTDITNFEWFAQLRFYWNKEKDVCVIRQTNTEYWYGYEYSGNSGRLVITPLTDRCYITLTTALHLFRGGSPKGPAGTGKTETVKDLGKALGMWVVVTNCSEGLDYKSIGKIFSGLAQTGAWGCFDEFNRINIEVLSVVAQQILSIYTALAVKLKRFVFEGFAIALKPTIGLFITMNPGYAGRTELPDNLKSMFRPISMCVPDTIIIAENILFSDGFQATKSLSRKVFALYQLAMRQLSHQFHYDFGLRSMAALLRYAGRKRRQLKGIQEDQIVYLAMRDMNVARLTSNDLPLFNGIMSDIFPGVSVPSIDYEHFKIAIEDELKANNKQVIHAAVNKTIELFETKNSRHSSMVLGDTGTAKSTTWQTLQGAFKRLKAAKMPGWEDAIVYPMNPKSVTLAELYGEYNLGTGEWFDGILSAIMRTVCAEETPTQKWILFDGPVDAVWIENMNSVMDDNKLLTLINGERITMPPQVSLVFEVHDLAVASPATVSRCGMVYNDYTEWGWQPYVRSWLARQRLPDYVNFLKEFFWRYLDKVLEFKRVKCVETVATNELNVVMSFCNLLDCFGTRENGITGDNVDVLETMTKLWFFFCMIWSVCATVNKIGRVRMDAFIREMEGLFPIKDTVYDYYVDPPAKSFAHWEEKLSADWELDTSLPFYKIVVPTVDTVRYEYLVSTYLQGGNPVLIVGDVGTGKTSTALSVIEASDKERISVLGINISAQTTASGLQDSIESRTEKRTKTTFAPIGGKTMIVFMDDFNMPAKDVYGSQPPLELIRQWVDYKFWYNRKTQQRTYIVQTLLLAAMGPPGGGRQVISGRTLSRFYIINMTFPSEATIMRIFGTMLQQKLNPFPSDIKSIWQKATHATINLYEAVNDKMLPTPKKMHYLFNLRDISRVFQGLLRSSHEYHNTKNSFLRLWYHESARVFSDRLVDDDDQSWFTSKIDEVLGRFLECTFNQICPEKRSPIFGDFKSPQGYYEDLTNVKMLKEYMNDMLNEYNQLPGTARLDVVFFEEALEHITRLARVLSQPRGHMLNIGIGGSGRQILTRLASYLCELGVFKIEVTKKYDTSSFREDLKTLYKTTGVKNKPTCFLFTGDQVVENNFLEIINNMLSTGEINLFKPEEFEELKSDLEGPAKRAGIMLNTENLYNYFMDTVRTNLHVCLCFSPIGESFRSYIRQYPALVNATCIDVLRDWPQNALLEVALKFLSYCKLYVAPPGEELQLNTEAEIQMAKDQELMLRVALAKIFSVVHTKVEKMSARMLLEVKRYNYVTSINYLELVMGYQAMLEKKRFDISSNADKLRNGLSKIAETQEKVELMSEDLKVSQGKVKELTIECDEFLVELSIKAREADEQKESVTAKSIIIGEEAIECNKLAAQAQADLVEVMPALDAAVRALDSLSKKDITEVKSYGRPPVKVQKVMEGVMILLQKDTSWESCKKVLGESKFLDDLKNFDKDNIPDKVLRKIAIYTHDPELEPEKVGVVSFACKSLMEWINAIENYGHVYRIVAPKKQALEDAMNSLRMKQLILEEAQKKLAELEAKLNELNNQFKLKMEEQNELQRKARQLELQLERAIILVESLGGEQERWKETVKRLDREFENLPGDCLIATAFMSYLGPFDTKYRIELQEVWYETVCEQQIPVTADVDMIKFLVDPVTIQEWNIQGLPSDDFSTENGILITRGQRWPLAIDPAGQAHSWIRNLEKDKLRIIDFGQSDYVKILERALQFGTPTLIQNVPQELDPTINPILRRSFVFQGGLKLINFNDKYIIYNEHFKLYITTKLPNPHYPPEVVAKVTLVNFSVKEVGLRNQLLGIIVREERPILEEQKNNLVFTIARSKRILLDLEDEILRLLKESKGSILEDEELFNTLQKSRQVSATVKESLATAEVTEVEIDDARLGYQPAATRAAILFFVLMDMAKIDPMYQFSLNAYTLLFVQSIERSTKCANLVERINNINTYHTYSVYKNTCRGLFEKHKLLFSMHMCSKILDAAEELNVAQYDFLLKGGIVLDRDSQVPNPFPEWITEASWDNITELDKEAGFHGIISSFEQHPKEWQEWYAAPQPERTPLVAEWKDVLDDFQKILVVRCLRLDRMSFCVSMFITHTLGEEFIQPPVLDLKSVFDESMSQTPLIFILSPGVDPTSSLLTLAEQTKMDKKLKSLSLGQGQSPAATKMLMTGIKEGHWVFLANCHLSLSWMPALDKMIEQMQSKKLHKRFRLWLSSSPHPEFPISILQTGIKMTTEPPRGIKANMKRLFAMITDENFKRSKVLSKYKKLLYSLCFFHTILLERKKFQQLGWNVVYSFNDSDFEISETILSLYLNEYENETPWGALKYLIAAVNYGGHVTDDWDRRLLTSYIDQYYNDDALESVNYRLSALPFYYIPRDGTIQNYQDQINLLPNFDKPEAFGQHMNADIASLISESRYMFETLLSLQVQAASAEGESREDKVLRLAGDMESKVPEILPYEQTAKLLGRNRTPLDVVLLQEIERYNKLLKGMKADLRDLQKGIKGLVVMSSELEDVFGAVYDGRVPAVWLKAYKSLKPLAAWARDLIFRVDHFATWARRLRPPALFWMTAFTFPPGFLTAVLQQAARSTLTPIDELTWEYAVFVEDDDTVARMILESGVCIRGTFLEGAGWNRKEKCLQEPKPMELVYPMPVIHFKPIEMIKKRTRGLYQCPCYYFPERAISYVTVCDLRVGDRTSDFWIKRGTALLLSLAS